MDEKEKLKDHLSEKLLETLSYYEEMSLEYIYLDIDKDFLVQNPQLTTQDLESSLLSLEKQKKITRSKQNSQSKWLKVFPKPSFFKRIKRFLKL